MNVADFKREVLARSVDEITQEIILEGDAAGVTEANRTFIIKRLGETFGVSMDTVRVWIVGSAKLGFSITEKKKVGHPTLPRFRPFRLESDIDVAVVSEPIYNLLWAELSRYAYSAAVRLPWDSGQLGHYMVHGWLRPDHFPKVHLRRCRSWWDLFGQLSNDRRFRPHPVRGALFHSFEDLVHYQSRSVTDCRQALELTS